MPIQAALSHSRVLTEITLEIKSGGRRGQGVDRAVRLLLKCDEVAIESVCLSPGEIN